MCKLVMALARRRSHVSATSCEAAGSQLSSAMCLQQLKRCHMSGLASSDCQRLQVPGTALSLHAIKHTAMIATLPPPIPSTHHTLEQKPCGDYCMMTFAASHLCFCGIIRKILHNLWA